MQFTNQPIGYWIKRADELLTKGINEIQSSLGLTRTGWQILNTIHEKGQVNSSEIASLLKSFADEQAVGSLLIEFREEYIVAEANQLLSLTEKGMELHAACFEKQKLFRQKMMNKISEQEYKQTISTLQRMIENLSGY